MTPFRGAALVFLIAVATIAGAWIYERAGYLPCDLCLKQRWAYYIGIPLAAAAMLIGWKGPMALARSLLVLLVVVFAASAVFGGYHAGVEWGFWPGPDGCTGTIAQTARDMNDFMKQLKTTKIIRCDEVALYVFGLSLAAWNAIISCAMAAIAGIAVFAEDTTRT